MKVAIIHNLYPPYARGGAEQVVLKTVQGLVEAGHEVRVLTFGPNGEEYSEDGRCAIYRFQPKNFFSYTESHRHFFGMRLLWHLRDIWNRDSARYVENILRTEKPDVVHTHNLMGLGFLIPRVIRKLGIPHIHTVHDVQLVEPSGIILKQKEKNFRYRGFPTKIYASIMRHLIGSPNVVISPSQFLLHFYERWGFFQYSKRVVLRNPVTLPATEINKKGKNKFTFLYLGQIETHKGVMLLAKAFCDFAEAFPRDSELLIVGSGSKMPELQALVRGNSAVTVYGKVEQNELPSIFERADITVVPSLCYENSPTVIFESFSYRTAVLASNIEGIAELIREKENGMTFAAGNAVALKEKLAWCVKEKSEVWAMGERGRQGVSDLSREIYLGQLIELYTFIIPEKIR